MQVPGADTMDLPTQRVRAHVSREDTQGRIESPSCSHWGLSQTAQGGNQNHLAENQRNWVTELHAEIGEDKKQQTG